jgi:tetratricopeptide (TPR) repeat protein
MFGDDTRARIRPELVAADQLYRAGKFAEAEASYQALLNIDPKLVAGQVGLVRAMLRQQKVDEALDAVNTASAAQSNSAALLAAKGEVQFRRAEMSDAELSYTSRQRSLIQSRWALISDWRGCTAPTPCTGQPMASCRSRTTWPLMMSKYKERGSTCFREKKNWRQSSPISAGLR